VIGVGVTAATIATGGGGIVAKAGISLVKAARRTGRMTSEFATLLTRLTNDAVNMPLLRKTLRTVDLTDLTRTERVLTDYSRNVKAARILPMLNRLGEINSAVGPAETIRLMRFVKTGENLDEVAVSAAWALRKLQVEATLPPLLTYATALRGRLQERLTPEQGARYARQAQQLHQLFGIMRFKDAEPLLREYVPKDQTDARARSAAVWALGLLHEDEPECDLGALFAERLADVDSLPPESNVVRWMAAVGLGRFKAAGQLETLQLFARRDTMYLETGIASSWAVSRITGEPMPPEPVDARKIGGWFLERP
jgi:HEAT repeat protein